LGRSHEASFPNPPGIAALEPSEGRRPFWSVMIPAFNPRKEHLEKTIGSVLEQGYGTEEMEIVVVDDCSPVADIAALVGSVAGGRVRFERNESNLGLAGCWNSCIERSRGQWIHILHQDDYISPGFYRHLQGIAESHPELGLLAARSFMLDRDGAIIGVTPRLLTLERGGNSIEEFFYQTPIQCPGVVVCRRCYEEGGGFRQDLKFTLDCEMWARVIEASGGLVTSQVLAYYRTGAGSESSRLWRTGEALADLAVLNSLFSSRYEGFDAAKARRKLLEMARSAELRMVQLGDVAGMRVCREFWEKNITPEVRFEWFLRRVKSLAVAALAKFVPGPSRSGTGTNSSLA